MPEQPLPTIREGWAGHVPIAWAEPAERRTGAPLVLWLPHLSGTAAAYAHVLTRLAADGYVAVSLDPWQHGRRGAEEPRALRERALGGYRREMWPILGHTTLDAVRVLDWAAAELGTGPRVLAGGVSMGGDAAVALAGFDRRVTRVAAVAATPDWARPHMHALDDPARPVVQGEAGAYAQFFFDLLNPATHLDAYRDGPPLAFDCGADDTHVPALDADVFREALPNAPIQVTVHPNLDHLATARSATVLDNALSWLTRR